MKTKIRRTRIPSVTYKKLPRGINGLWIENKRPPYPDALGKIQINFKLKGKELLDVLVHELLHEYFPDVTEDKVTTTATCIAEVLWSHRFREVVVE